MMRVSRRRATRLTSACLLAAVCAGACVAPPAAQAAFGVEEANFEAGTCLNQAGCAYTEPPLLNSSHRRRATRPSASPRSKSTTTPKRLGQAPDGNLRNIRVDIPAGLAADPEALPQCPIAEFNANKCPPDTEVGENELTLFVQGANVEITGKVYNLQQPPGLPLDFGIDIGVEPLVGIHSFLEGHVEWSGDYHEYFEIKNVPKEGEEARPEKCRSRC